MNKCIQCDRKRSKDCVPMKEKCTFNIKRFICRDCSTCICGVVSPNRPVQKLFPSENPIIKLEDINFLEVKVCFSLPYICLQCTHCGICKQRGRFPGHPYHDTCVFMMMVRGKFGPFGDFPKEIMKMILSFVDYRVLKK